MSTAIDDWAANQDQGPAASPEPVDENELIGGGPEDGRDHQEVDDAEAVPVSPEDARLAEKRAKDARIMKVTGGILGAIVLAVGGVAGYSKFVTPEPVMQQPAAAQQAPMDRTAVAAAAATAASEAGQGGAPVAPVGMAAPSAAPSAAPDFGLQQPGAAAPVVAAPGAQQVLQAPPVQPPVAAAPVVAPVMAAAPVSGAASARAIASATQQAAVAPGEVERLHAELAELRAEHEKVVAGLRQEIAALSKGGQKRSSRADASAPAPAPAPVRTAAVAPVKEKPFDGITERAEPSQQRGRSSRATTVVEHYEPVTSPVMTEPRNVPVAPSAAAKGGKVRSDFTIYAISNGRAWVHWNSDNENHMVGPNSVLPDGSRVTQLDDTKGVVFTTNGEIHPRPVK